MAPPRASHTRPCSALAPPCALRHPLQSTTAAMRAKLCRAVPLDEVAAGASRRHRKLQDGGPHLSRRSPSPAERRNAIPTRDRAGDCRARHNHRPIRCPGGSRGSPSPWRGPSTPSRRPLVTGAPPSLWGPIASCSHRRSAPLRNPPATVYLQPRWAHLRVPLVFLYPFLASAEPETDRSADDLSGQTRPFPVLCSIWGRRWGRSVLHLSPCPCKCLANFAHNPLEKSHSSHIDPTEHFYRSNPEFYPFHEHCLLCLRNLFSYSLKSIVNHEQVLFILFSPYLLCFSTVLIRSSCVRFIIM
jgi:hypothetical protein